MILLLSVRTSGECMEDVGYALVDVTPNRLGELLGRMAVARRMSSENSTFLSLEFWDGCVQWVASCSEELEEALGGDELVVLDEWPELSSEEKVDCECSTLVVYTSDVHWEATTGCAQVESAWVSRVTLEGLRE